MDMTVRIVTDSTCDLPPTVINDLEITVIPLYINVGSKGYLDGIEISRQEFYARLPSFRPHPTTAAPGQDVFQKSYFRLVEEGATQILSIHVSQKLSAVFGIALSAAQSIQMVPVTVLDSRQLTLGTGFLAETAARMAKEGAHVNEILPVLEDQISRTHVFAALDTVEFLRRSGRTSFAMASIASLLHVKPLLRMYDGNPTSERVRTTGKAIRRLIELLEQAAPLERVALVHTHSPEKADYLRRQASHLMPEGEIPSVDITPVIGAHLGPGAAGFACISRR